MEFLAITKTINRLKQCACLSIILQPRDFYFQLLLDLFKSGQFSHTETNT